MSQTEVQLIKSSSVEDGDIVGMSSSKLSGTLPAISAANLTNIPAANLTGTLPAVSGANLTNLPAANLTGTLPAISGANLTGISAGITEADVWRLSTDVGGSQGTLSTLTSWERADDPSAAYIGTGMTFNTDHWYFPSTGKWLINLQLGLYGQYAFHFGWLITQFRSSGSDSYEQVALAMATVSGNGGYGGGFSQALVDVTQAGSSGAKCYIDQQTQSSSGRFISGSTNKNQTSVAFIRLGDT